MTPIRTAVIGCGTISDIYLQNLTASPDVQVVACADLDPERARTVAAQHGVPGALTPDEVYASDQIDLVVNLTTPDAHADVALAALRGGKHVYNEKPLALDLTQARAMLDLAAERGLRVGCAPDTVLGAGIQTCRAILDAGTIGEPVAATAFMANHGHEHWHPNPHFYYQPGAGPMFDMGPYYLTSLVTLIGSVTQVAAMARASFPERVISSEPLSGQRIPVNTPTHVTGTLAFENGAIGTVITSFDVWGSNLPLLEIHGTKGSLSLPDPNTFGGPVRVKVGREEWRDVPLTHPHPSNSRGLGVTDMARAITEGRPHRASGDVAYHVLEIMHAFLGSAARRASVAIDSRIERPLPMQPEVQEVTS